MILVTLSIICFPWSIDDFFLTGYFFCKVLNGYTNIISSYSVCSILL